MTPRTHSEKVEAAHRLAVQVDGIGVPLHTFLRDPLWRDQRLAYFSGLVRQGWTPAEISLQWGAEAAKGLERAPLPPARPAPRAAATPAHVPPPPPSERRISQPARAPFLSAAKPEPPPPVAPARMVDGDGILVALRRGPMSTSAIAELVGRHVNLVGIFLVRLRKEGLVKRDGSAGDWSLKGASADDVDEPETPALLEEDDREPDYDHAGSPDVGAVDLPDDDEAEEVLARETEKKISHTERGGRHPGGPGVPVDPREEDTGVRPRAPAGEVSASPREAAPMKREHYTMTADQQRSRILELLAIGSQTVASLSADMGVSQPDVRNRLYSLRDRVMKLPTGHWALDVPEEKMTRSPNPDLPATGPLSRQSAEAFLAAATVPTDVPVPVLEKTMQERQKEVWGAFIPRPAPVPIPEGVVWRGSRIVAPPVSDPLVQALIEERSRSLKVIEDHQARVQKINAAIAVFSE